MEEHGPRQRAREGYFHALLGRLPRASLEARVRKSGICTRLPFGFSAAKAAGAGRRTCRQDVSAHSTRLRPNLPKSRGLCFCVTSPLSSHARHPKVAQLHEWLHEQS